MKLMLIIQDTLQEPTYTFRSLLHYCLHRNTLNTVQHVIIYSIQDPSIHWHCS